MGKGFRSVLLEWRERSDRNGSSTLRRERRGGLVAQAAVRPLLVVLHEPPPGEPTRLGQIHELLHVQQFVP